MVVIREADAGVAAHAVAVVNSKAFSTATDITKGTVIYFLVRAVVVKVAYPATVACKWYTLRGARRVYAVR